MRIGSSWTIKGDLTAAEDMTVDFVFEGYIDLPGHTLVVADGSRVKATVIAKGVTVNGFHADVPKAGGTLAGELWLTRHGGYGGGRDYRLSVRGD